METGPRSDAVWTVICPMRLEPSLPGGFYLVRKRSGLVTPSDDRRGLNCVLSGWPPAAAKPRSSSGNADAALDECLRESGLRPAARLPACLHFPARVVGLR